MTLRLVDTGWGTELTRALQADASALRIICPFIKVDALKRLLAPRPKALRVITRFNLADFADGVSDIEALRKVLAVGGQVRGVRGLHAKLYLFGDSCAVVTSANLTAAALDRNAEFGAVLRGASEVASCRSYFDQLWSRAGSDITNAQLDGWQQVVARHRAAGGWQGGGMGLGDFGADASQGIAGAPPATSASTVGPVPLAAQSFVKFLGMGSDRVALGESTLSEIERAGCHRILAYPEGKRPTGVDEGALMFIGRLTRQDGENDIRIFGRAWAYAHEPGVDDATWADIARRDWRKTWPHYVRVRDAEFLNGIMANGVSLNDLMSTLGADAFAATQSNRKANLSRGAQKLNENPRTAYRQQPAVRLSTDGQAWLAERLQQSLALHGAVPKATLDGIV
jgi:hypothetical protein